MSSYINYIFDNEWIRSAHRHLLLSYAIPQTEWWYVLLIIGRISEIYFLLLWKAVNSFSSSTFQYLFEILFNSRQWILSRCYSLIPLRCKHFFAQHNFKRDVKVIDLSHCYWFSTSTIISSLINFNNLEELHVNDTKTSLTSIGKIFEKCHSIKKLSIDVKENNWSEYLDTTQRLRSGDKALKEGIKKLISLRLCFKGNSCGVWHLIFQVLRYRTFQSNL